MIKTVYFTKVIAVIFCLTIINSCEHQKEINPDKPIRVIDGRIAFKNMDALNSFMKDAQSKRYDDFLSEIKALEKEGFYSLIPIFDISEKDAIEKYRDAKLARIKRYSPDRSTPVAKVQLDDPDDEDHLIADPYYAATLNTQREIQVGETVYNYNETGLYYTKQASASKLSPYLETAEIEFLNKLPEGTEFEIEENIYISKVARIAPPIPNEPTDGGGSGIFAPPSASSKDPLDPYNYKMCSKVRDNIFADIFGPSSVCSDYFESDKRIKTKVWNQNYFLYSSIGISVRSQNRFLRVWWRDKIDELRLGYSHATFKYPSIDAKLPNYDYSFYYEYNGYTVNQYGSLVKDRASNPKTIFNKFPIRDSDKSLIKIYYYDPFKSQNDFFELSGEKLNEFLSNQTQSGIKTLAKLGESNLETKSVLLTKFDPQDVYFAYSNWKDKETNSGAIIEVFDWNTGQIKFTINPGSGGGLNWSPKYNARSYSKFKVEMYGIGKRGSKYRGSRIEFED